MSDLAIFLLIFFSEQQLDYAEKSWYITFTVFMCF